MPETSYHKTFQLQCTKCGLCQIFLTSPNRPAAPAKPLFPGTLECPCHWQRELVLVFPQRMQNRKQS